MTTPFLNKTISKFGHLILILLLNLTILCLSFAQEYETLKCIQTLANWETRSIASINGEEIWTISGDQHLYRWEEKQFKDVSEYGETYNMLFASSDSELWIHYFDHKAVRYKFKKIKDGITTYIDDPENFSLTSFWINSSNDIWLGGLVGTMLHYDGERWKKYPGFTNNHITNIFINKDKNGFTTIEDDPTIKGRYRLSLDSKRNIRLKKVKKTYSFFGISDHGYWAGNSDSLYFISNDKQEKLFPIKTIPTDLIPFEKNYIYNTIGHFR